jgi:MYXO-CTERM domain-containing protein
VPVLRSGMTRIRRALLVVPILAMPATAMAAPVWVGDFEDGDISQWDNALNGQVDGVDYITVVGDVIVQGSYAGRIELHDDALWPNGLRRVELHHGPTDGRTDEGATTWFAWSFYLPEALPDDPGTTIGYWESNSSYHQMMAFNTNGEDIRFITQEPDYVEQWNGPGMFTAGVWHRIAMRVLWSKSADTGEVEVYFDGEQVLASTHTQTLADDNNHFTQLGLLRGDMDFDDVPVIYLDDVVEGDSIEDVHPDLEPSGEDTGTSSTGEPPGDTTDAEGGSTAAGTTGGADESTSEDGGVSASGSATAATTAGATASAGTGSDGESTGAGADDDDAGGCSCDAGSTSGSLGGLVLAMLAVARRRRR